MDKYQRTIDPVFSDAWASAWAVELNRNEAYRKSAENWEWPIVLVMETPAEDRAVYVDLWRGMCRGARPANADDFDTVPYIISGSGENWLRILDGKIDPMMALMRGKLRLKKGKLTALARYSGAAKQLIISAARIGRQTEITSSSPAQPAPEGIRPVQKRLSTSTGLRHDTLPMRLYHKAKRLGIWNPLDINLDRDKEQWQRLTDLEKDGMLRLISLFQAGEESVTLDLLPLILVIAGEGRLEEEMFLTTFLWEEAKHVEFFHRFIDEVAGECGDLARYHTPSYRQLFYEELPAAMNALLGDSSPSAQLNASVTYNMVVEGVLAETGYHAFYESLEQNDLLPGLREGIGYLKRDESRHIAYGIYLLARLINTDPSLWPRLEQRMTKLVELALNSITEAFDSYEVFPFGLQLDDFIDFATGQFNKRIERLERAKTHNDEEDDDQA